MASVPGAVSVLLPVTIGAKPVFYEIDTGAGYTSINPGATKRLVAIPFT